MDTPPILEPRQGRVITQIITRPYTTITAYVTLGGSDEPPAAATPTPFTPQPTPNGVGGGGGGGGDGGTSSAPVVPTTSSSSSLSAEQVGTIVGSVLGFFVLLFVVCCCLSLRRRRIQERIAWERAGSYTTDDSYVEIQDTWTRPVQQPGLVPPPPRFPPTRYAPYRHTRHPQIPGVRQYP
ncbi:hypothetical protein B0T22DRAFT_494726 [Podospora appendiculata]|uniref:Uncharacterized protein n=1 Tax=Podospora appendiculata TaxID=314037 RepID=A0AAE1C7L3_9PEZI|nr:hypothetical protein B0T22DRAFT_494726 [Podospora appendiculata]